MRYQVKVVPRSSRCSVEKLGDGRLKVKLNAPPVKGAANIQLIEVLADYFHVKKGHITLISGLGSSKKIVEIQ